MKKIIVFVTAVVSVSWTAQSAAVTKTGTTAANFLKASVGSRAVGMGGAFVARASDLSAMYWNPSGIARLSGAGALFCHTRWLADIGIDYAALAVPAGRLGTLGVSAMFMSMDEMERTTINEPDGTGEMFDAGSYAVGLTYASNLTDRFSIGGSVKVIHETIYHSSATGIAFDIGTLFTTQLSGLNIGMSITNYGMKMQMGGRDMMVQHDIDALVSGNNQNINANLQTESYDLPLMFRVGVSMDLLKGRGNSNLLLSVDALHPNDDVESLNLGGEYVFNRMFSLRAGYNSLFAQEAEPGLCAGAGICAALKGDMTLVLDYAYMDFGVLKEVQMFTLALGF